jgi:hypothetical protein
MLPGEGRDPAEEPGPSGDVFSRVTSVAMVFAIETDSSDTPHDEQKRLSSGIRVRQDGHFVMAFMPSHRIVSAAAEPPECQSLTKNVARLQPFRGSRVVAG